MSWPTNPNEYPRESALTACLHEDLVEFTVGRLDALVAAHFPDFRIPRIFAGHPVAPDVRADLAFTLGLLGAGGVERVAGVEVSDALETVLRPIDGAGTHSFFSYRIAETLIRFPSLRERFDDDTTARLEEACDSTSFVSRLREGKLPRNYASVLLRCEVARQRLGLDVDPDLIDELTARTLELLDANPGGYLDDSQSGIGRYDIYSGDIYLFTEPMRDRFPEVWERGARAALDLVERVGATNGAAFSWGRSSGALATCLTIELAGLAVHHRLTDAPDRWIGRGTNAFGHLGSWFASDGLITAHQYRSTFGYRGPFRRLQMTLDCLGKLADTALTLRTAKAHRAVPVDRDDLFEFRDEFIAFDSDRHAGVWTYRSADLVFVLPVVGSTVSDYLPAPHNPGLFEVPVEADLPTAVPSLYRDGVHYTSGHLPTSLTKTEGGLVLTYDGFGRSPRFEQLPDDEPLGGSRQVSYRVEGRTLRVEESLSFDGASLPDAIAVQVAEAKDRPLRVEFHVGAEVGSAATVIDVSGLKEYRSFWGELPRVHQVDLDPATQLDFGWSVTPMLRVLTTAQTHHYHRGVYDPLAAQVVDRQISTGRLLGDPTYLAAWDQFHLHWPEWFIGPDLGRHRAAIEILRSSGVRIIWTQHNLVPHDKDKRQEAIYGAWAGGADGIVHHSEYGRRRVTERYAFRDDAIHRVIPHLDFGHLMADIPDPARRDDGPIRIGIVGAPRAEKDVQSVLDAFASTTRDDLELHVFSLGAGDVVPDDPRITAVPYEMVDRAVYDERLRSLDGLLLPFVEGDMITTGTVGDIVGAGIAAITSGWGYLTEALGDAAIPYGDDLAATLDRLDWPSLERAARAAVALRPIHSARAVAAAHLALLEAVGTSRL